MESAKKLVNVKSDGRDEIQWEPSGEGNKVTFIGCFEFSELVRKYRAQFGNDVLSWPAPVGTTHAEMILREFVLKLRGQWNYPYQEDEICHCRKVKTKTVDQAILNGAHTHELAMQWTGCSSACGTCKPDVEKIIKHRVG